jgi:hypothetical protein
VFNDGVRRRRAAAWLLSIPLMVVGSEVAHVLAYRWVYPQAQVRLRALLATGHSYMLGPAGFWPLLFGVVGGIELVAVSWVLVGSVSRSAYKPVPAWAFGLVPPIGFVVQEFLERWLAGISFPWQMVLEPTFRIGLLLQIPFGLAGFLLARLLLGAADHVRRALWPIFELPRLVAGVCQRAPETGWLPRVAVLAGGHAGRGPPFLIADC